MESRNSSLLVTLKFCDDFLAATDFLLMSRPGSPVKLLWAGGFSSTRMWGKDFLTKDKLLCFVKFSSLRSTGSETKEPDEEKRRLLLSLKRNLHGFPCFNVADLHDKNKTKQLNAYVNQSFALNNRPLRSAHNFSLTSSLNSLNLTKFDLK